MKNKIIIIVSVIIIFCIGLSITIVGLENTNKRSITISSTEIEIESIRMKYSGEDNIDIETISDKLFQEKVLNLECDKRKIKLDDNNLNQLRKIAFNNDISEDNLNEIKEMNMTEEEFRQDLYNDLIEMQRRVILKEKLLYEINNNNVSVDDDEFIKKVNDFNISKESGELDDVLSTLDELSNEYVNILERKYTKELVD